MRTIRAELIGDNTIVADGVAYKHRTPLLHLARVVAATGEKCKIDAYRGSAIAISGETDRLAKTTVLENEKFGPRFGKFVPFREGVFG